MIVPDALSARTHTFNMLIGGVLLFSLVLLALARASRPNVYVSMAIGLVKISGVRGFVRDSLPMNGRASLMLLMNYWVASSLIVFLMTDAYPLTNLDHWILASAAPLAVLGLHLGSMILTGWVAGERDVFRAPIMMKLIGAQFLGIIYFVCALVWVFQPHYKEITLQVVLWSFVIESSFRILKSISVVWSLKVSWYYIILYFCTLEIMPLFVCYYYTVKSLEN